MGYNPRKRPEMGENTSFPDPSRVVYQGSQGIEILLDSKIMGYNTQIASFADLSRVVYRGSQGNEILPGLENHGLRKRPEMSENTSFSNLP